MGTLTLPTGGLAYVDANVIIYRVERVAQYDQITRSLWNALDAEQQQVITSEVST